MKIFVILSRVPYPLEKGDKLRAYHQLDLLSKQHEIILCCLSEKKVSIRAHQELKKISKQYFIFPLKKWKIVLNLGFCLFSRKPYQVMYFYQRAIHRKISALIRSYHPDHIYCQLIRTSEYAKHEHNFTKTLDYQDAFSKGMERRRDNSRWPLKELFDSERRRLITYENIIFEYFEKKSIISEEDRRYIYHPQRDTISVVENGIDTKFFKPAAIGVESFDLVFTGNMSYPPNIDAAILIVEKLLPILRTTHPEISLLIAGSSPHKRILNLSQHNGVTVSGWIEDIRDAYAKGAIFIAPMQIGTGLQNKLLEAMAMQMPCVTSVLANKSIKAIHGEVLYAVSEISEYCECILKLRNDVTLRKEMGKKARSFVQKEFSWERTVGHLDALMSSEIGS